MRRERVWFKTEEIRTGVFHGVVFTNRTCEELVTRAVPFIGMAVRLPGWFLLVCGYSLLSLLPVFRVLALGWIFQPTLADVMIASALVPIWQCERALNLGTLNSIRSVYWYPK